MKLNNKTCKYHKCGKKIDGHEKAVGLLTFDRGNIREEVFFHFQCYLDWFKECVDAHANKIIDEAMPIAQEATKGLLPQFAQMFFPEQNDEPKDAEDNSS